MNDIKEFAFVLDSERKKLSPTPVNKAWYLIRNKKATLVEKYPMVIHLTKTINEEDIDTSEIVLGIDDGSKYVGLGIVQHTRTKKTKPVFKGTLRHRNDVKKKMELRQGERRYRRSHKEYRSARFNNRSASTRKGRLAPSIKQKKEAVLRTVNKFNQWIRIDRIVLEDVLIDIRVLTEGERLYGKGYTKSNRLNSNLRLAVLMRDSFTCQLTGEKNAPLEVHHITPKRFNGADTLGNLITLSKKAHASLGKNEREYQELFYDIVKGKNTRFDYAQHVMQGKTYLREELSKIALTSLTTGALTSDNRHKYNIKKSHANDALVIAGIRHENHLKDWIIRPLRKKSKAQNTSLTGILKHGDVVEYSSKRTGRTFKGYLTAIRANRKNGNVQTFSEEVYRGYTLNNMKLVWRFKNIMWT